MLFDAASLEILARLTFDSAPVGIATSSEMVAVALEDGGIAAFGARDRERRWRRSAVSGDLRMAASRDFVWTWDRRASAIFAWDDAGTQERFDAPGARAFTVGERGVYWLTAERVVFHARGGRALTSPLLEGASAAGAILLLRELALDQRRWFAVAARRADARGARDTARAGGTGATSRLSSRPDLRRPPRGVRPGARGRRQRKVFGRRRAQPAVCFGYLGHLPLGRRERRSHGPCRPYPVSEAMREAHAERRRPRAALHPALYAPDERQGQRFIQALLRLSTTAWRPFRDPRARSSSCATRSWERAIDIPPGTPLGPATCGTYDPVAPGGASSPWNGIRRRSA